MEKKKGLKMPNAFIIVFIIMVIVTILTYIIPAGNYELVEGSNSIDPETFHYLERTPISLWDFINSIFSGMTKSATIIMFTFLLGGYFNVLIATKSIDAFISMLIRKLGDKSIVIIPIMTILMSLLGAVGVMANPVVALIPVGVILAKKLKLDQIMAVALMFVAAYCGYAMSPMCPMTVQTAQKIAEIPLMSGFAFRCAGYGVILISTILYMMYYAKKITKNKALSVMGEEYLSGDLEEETEERFTIRDAGVLFSLVIGMGVYTYGSLNLGWGLEYMAGIMLIVAIAAAIISGMSADDLVKNFVKGASQMTFSALLIGCATAISVILTQGNILHTIIFGLSNVLAVLPSWLVGPVMYYVNIVFNFFVSSGSGQAAIVMPIMAPLADTVGITRQMAICAFQYGDGLSNLIFPTNGTMMACIALAGVKYDKWLKWMMPLFGIWLVISTILVIIGVSMGIA